MTFSENPDWQHGEVFTALFETIMMAVLGTIIAALVRFAAGLSRRTQLHAISGTLAVRHAPSVRLPARHRHADLVFDLHPRLSVSDRSQERLRLPLPIPGLSASCFPKRLENIDNKQVEGVRATGASQIQRYRFGVIPQILPVFVSQVLYYLESNTRSATVIGALGAGGIGLMLVETMKTSRDWENTSYIIILTILVVIMMDQASGWLRRKLIEGK